MRQFLRQFVQDHLVPGIFSMRGGRQNFWFLLLSDLSIAAAHFAIVLVLLQVIFKRKDQLFFKVVMLFALFIGFRGVTQTLALWTVWNPEFQMGDGVRAVTTILSVVTAIVLVVLLPALHRLPSVGQLEQEVSERRRVEEEMRVRERRFQTVIESFQDHAIYRLNAAGILESWSRGGERIHGYKEREVVGTHFSCLFAPAEIASGRPEEILKQAVESGKLEDEGWRVRKDGSRFWAHYVIHPLWDGEGELTGYSKITHDLTGSHEMEARFKALMELAPDAILMTDSQGIIEFANAQVEKLYGYSRAEVVGRSIAMLTPERLQEEYEHRRQAYLAAPKILHVPTPQDTASGFDLVGMRRDGSEFSCEMSISPIVTKSGTASLRSIRDITDRKLAEIRFRSLLESAPDAMVIVDPQGQIELANMQTEKLFGYTRAELAGQLIEMLVPDTAGDADESHSGLFLDAPQKREMGVGVELLARHKNGSLFPVEISLSPLEGPNGVTVTAAIRDVTEARMAARHLSEKLEELRHSNEELAQFAHIASHDLQEPLRMVASYTQLLAKRYKGRLDSDADEFIDYAVDGTQRMKRLIQDLLVYSRSGKGAPPVREFASELALRAALNNLHVAIDESAAVVTSGPLPTILTGDLQMIQVFQNLIGNAIKYRGDRTPQIHVSAVKEGKEWIFSVRDNGIGIEAKYHERIFVIFQRLHAREEYEGTGIGLAICKRILKQLSGRVWVESEVGIGSTFHFALPVR